MKKVKKMAEGGITGLGGLLGMPDFSPMPTPGLGGPLAGVSPYGGGGGGGSAMEGLGTVNQGASAIGSALSRASDAIGGGGGGARPEPMAGVTYKKGGKVTTTRRVSTGERSKKSPNW